MKTSTNNPNSYTYQCIHCGYHPMPVSDPECHTCRFDNSTWIQSLLKFGRHKSPESLLPEEKPIKRKKLKTSIRSKTQNP